MARKKSWKDWDVGFGIRSNPDRDHSAARRQISAAIFRGIKRDSLIRPNGSACLTDSRRTVVSASPAAPHSREIGSATAVRHYSFISARRHLRRLNAATGPLYIRRRRRAGGALRVDGKCAGDAVSSLRTTRPGQVAPSCAPATTGCH